MSSACPACGVAVIPGYVRCPKCQAALPRTVTRRLGGGGGGGTAVAASGGGFPVLAVVGAIAVAGAIIAFFATRSDGDRGAPSAPATPTTPAVSPGRTTTAGGAGAAAGGAPELEARLSDPEAPTLASLAGRLERDLKRQRLWSTISIAGARLDVRSSSCREAGLVAAVDGALGDLRGAGLTKLRCIEPSGKVVFEREP